jgi:hypothetical protein
LKLVYTVRTSYIGRWSYSRCLLLLWCIFAIEFRRFFLSRLVPNCKPLGGGWPTF